MSRLLTARPAEGADSSTWGVFPLWGPDEAEYGYSEVCRRVLYVDYEGELDDYWRSCHEVVYGLLVEIRAADCGLSCRCAAEYRVLGPAPAARRKVKGVV